ncbi:MAG: sodium:proline symporter [Pseudomonadota bacterium]
MLPILTASIICIALFSYVLSPRVRTVSGFFGGLSETGQAPTLWTIVLSQVTTWIFARSLLNAGILGYFYGLPGVLAYAAYYLSFLSGAWIIDALRFRHGHGSVQGYLADHFGTAGTACYNFVVALRLASEVFANLLVIGILFGQEGSLGYILSILAVAGLTLGYSMLGGLRASLRTDVFQATALVAVLAVLLVQTLGAPDFSLPASLSAGPDGMQGPGWTLLVVALLQVWSYPLHDPVMMDRGFLADRRTTRLSFYHACWISLVLILAFGLLGLHAGAHRLEGEDIMVTLTRIMGSSTMILLNIALVLSAVSTLDSTLSSAAKLSILGMGLGPATLFAGRTAMVAFMGLGLVLLFFGNEDLFDAVAISGTASLFLAPVVFFCIWRGWRVRRWAYLTAFAAAVLAAAVYFLESSSYTNLVGALAGLEHAYSKLLLLCLLALGVGCGAFVAGRIRKEERTS